MKGFCYLGNNMVNASGGSEAAVTARARIGWVKFKECGELLNSKKSSCSRESNGKSNVLVQN